MSYTTINKSTEHFNTKLYTGNGSARSITGVGFQPDWVWVKDRSDAQNHGLRDVVRGATKRLVSNDNAAENTQTQGLSSFDSDGFSLGTGVDVNANSDNYVSWNWKANGAGSANTDGDINSTVSVNQTAGFSIVKYTGTDVAGATVGHGLNAVPKWIIVKRLAGSGYDWVVYHANDTAGLYLNSDGYNNDSSSNNIWFNGAAPTSSVFSIGTDGRIGDATDFIAYCFAEKTGYSKFGKYIGNGNADGTFVYTGFKPAWVMFKRIDNSSNWHMQDNKRIGYNLNNYRLYADVADAETTSGVVDFLSNGFKFRATAMNTNGGTFIYTAFGQSIVGSNNIPATAR